MGLFLVAEKLGKLKEELREAEDALVKALAGIALFICLNSENVSLSIDSYCLV